MTSSQYTPLCCCLAPTAVLYTIRFGFFSSFILYFIFFLASGSCTIGFYVHTTHIATAREYYVLRIRKIHIDFLRGENKNNCSKTHYCWPLKNSTLTSSIPREYVTIPNYNVNTLYYNKTSKAPITHISYCFKDTRTPINTNNILILIHFHTSCGFVQLSYLLLTTVNDVQSLRNTRFCSLYSVLSSSFIFFIIRVCLIPL